MNIRKLTDQERKVLEFLIAHSDIAKKKGIVEWFESCRCESLSDGNMGSIRFVSIEENAAPLHFSYTAVEAEFVDKDRIPVIVSLNISNEGYPLELDFWKVDFAPLIEYPSVEDLKLLGKSGESG